MPSRRHLEHLHWHHRNLLHHSLPHCFGQEPLTMLQVLGHSISFLKLVFVRYSYYLKMDHYCKHYIEFTYLSSSSSFGDPNACPRPDDLLSRHGSSKILGINLATFTQILSIVEGRLMLVSAVRHQFPVLLTQFHSPILDQVQPFRIFSSWSPWAYWTTWHQQRGSD